MSAEVSPLSPSNADECEGCFARQPIGTFNLGGVETPLCAGCSVFRSGDGAEVILPNGPV